MDHQLLVRWIRDLPWALFKETSLYYFESNNDVVAFTRFQRRDMHDVCVATKHLSCSMTTTQKFLSNNWCKNHFLEFRKYSFEISRGTQTQVPFQNIYGTLRHLNPYHKMLQIIYEGAPQMFQSDTVANFVAVALTFTEMRWHLFKAKF